MASCLVAPMSEVIQVAAALIFYISVSTPASGAKRVTYSEFLTQIMDGKIEAVRVTGTEMVGTIKTADKSKKSEFIATPRLPSMDESWVMQDLRARNIQIIAEPQAGS